MRLVHTIGVIRWVAMGLIALGVLSMTALTGAGMPQGAEYLSVLALTFVPAAVAALVVYVFFGWLQQTLLMLVGIAKNTASDDILSRF
ncbi:hypothetical protein SAMN04489844_1631 [Nocardioides exalbidus]|uniref:Uncharacterized protein n=2 Tax=Nocardioides exalbidus TaxID=402596 RepID=A0A1H4PKA1_9ACTN|nr:hypothetical protein SAMN04489844_1631 [Nocardioides exalbidus]